MNLMVPSNQPVERMVGIDAKKKGNQKRKNSNGAYRRIYLYRCLLKNTVWRSGILYLTKSPSVLEGQTEMVNNAEKDGTISLIPRSGRVLGIKMKSTYLLRLISSTATNGLKYPNLFLVGQIMQSKTIFTRPLGK